MAKRALTKDFPVCQMTFPLLSEYRWRRKERLGIAGFIIIEERPEEFFSEEEWRQYFWDDMTANHYIDWDLPVPEDVEIRLLEATSKIKRFFQEHHQNNR